MGVSGVAMRQASSRCSSPRSTATATTSPAQPPVSGPSSTTTSRFVFATDPSDRLRVERADRAQVDDLGLDPLLGQPLGRGQALVHAAHGRDDRHVASFPAHRRLAERRGRAVHLALDGVQALVLEEDHRVVVVDRRAEERLSRPPASRARRS